jgi:hypothetical protein
MRKPKSVVWRIFIAGETISLVPKISSEGYDWISGPFMRPIMSLVV